MNEQTEDAPRDTSQDGAEWAALEAERRAIPTHHKAPVILNDCRAIWGYKPHPRSYGPTVPLQGYTQAQIMNPTAADKRYYKAHPITLRLETDAVILAGKADDMRRLTGHPTSARYVRMARVIDKKWGKLLAARNAVVAKLDSLNALDMNALDPRPSTPIFGPVSACTAEEHDDTNAECVCSQSMRIGAA